jgi:hypothetical protein
MKKQLLLLIIFAWIFFGCKKAETNPTKVTSNVYTATTWLYSSPYYYYDINDSDITADNIKSASVSVYFSTDNGNTWTAIPFTQYTNSSNYFMGYNTQVGKIQITWVYNNTLSQGDSPNTYYGATLQYKVVVVSN